MNRIVKNPFLPLILAFGMLISFAVPSRAGTPTEDKTPKLTITWEEKRLSVDVVDTDIREVMKAISEKSGVTISVFEGVTGKVSLREENAPLEKAVDRLLSAIGQRNYLMVYQGDGLKKLDIVSKGIAGRSLGGKVNQPRITGVLRNGKEIEYFPGELVVWLRNKDKKSKQQIESIIAQLEHKHGLSLIHYVNAYAQIALLFRILDGRDVLSVMYEILEGDAASVDLSHVVPNGFGVAVVEMPEEGFHDYSLTSDDRDNIKSRGISRRQYLKERFPFVKEGVIATWGNEQPYIDGQFKILVSSADAKNISYDDLLYVMNVEGGSILRHLTSTNGDSDYMVYFPTPMSIDDYNAKLNRLRNIVDSMRKTSYSGAFPDILVNSNGQPCDDLRPSPTDRQRTTTDN